MLPPEELKDFETEIAEMFNHNLAQVDQVYMPHVESQVAIASALIQKHIWHVSETHEEVIEHTAGESFTETEAIAGKATVLVIVPTKKAVSYTVHDMSSYLPHMKIGEHGIHSEPKHSGKGKGVIHKPGLIKVLQAKDLVICAEETLFHCLQVESIQPSQLTLLVYLNWDLSSKAFPILSGKHRHQFIKTKTVLFTKSLLDSDQPRNMQTLCAMKHLEGLGEVSV